MSKTALKKELQGLDADALRGLLIGLYDARKEAREYLDFFADPDVDKLLTRYKAAVDKEIERVTRRRARPRMTFVRRLIKNFASLNPGDEWVAELMVHTVETACRVGCYNEFKELTQVSVARHLGETLKFIDTCGMAGEYLPRLIEAVEAMDSRYLRSRGFRQLLRESIAGYRARF